MPLPDQLAALVARSRPAVWRYLRTLGCDAATADDLTQDAFVVVLERQGFDASNVDAAFGFLRTTARHLWLRSARRSLTTREVEAADRVWEEQCGEGEGLERQAALRACIDALPPRSRDLLAATYGDRASRAASSRRFGLSEDGVKSALRRLRAALQECIERRLRRELR